MKDLEYIFASVTLLIFSLGRDILCIYFFCSFDMIPFGSLNIFKIVYFESWSSKSSICATADTISIGYFFFLCKGHIFLFLCISHNFLLKLDILNKTMWQFWKPDSPLFPVFVVVALCCIVCSFCNFSELILKSLYSLSSLSSLLSCFLYPHPLASHQKDLLTLYPKHSQNPYTLLQLPPQSKHLLLSSRILLNGLPASSFAPPQSFVQQQRWSGFLQSILILSSKATYCVLTTVCIKSTST